MRSKIIIGLVALAALVGRDQRAWREQFIPKEDAEFSRNYLALFAARDFEAIEAKIDPRLRGAQLRPELEQIAAFFPAEKPRDVQTAKKGTEGLNNNPSVPFFSVLAPGRRVVRV